MKSFKYLFLLVIALTITVASCKKDEEPKSKKELLTSNQWRFLSSKTDGVADMISNCEKDDFMIFASNGTYTWNPGTVKCNSHDTIITGTWTLSTDEKTLTLDGSDLLWTIVELTDNKLVYSIVLSIEHAHEYTYIAL